MSFVIPILDPRIAEIAPGFRALSISVEATGHFGLEIR